MNGDSLCSPIGPWEYLQPKLNFKHKKARRHCLVLQIVLHRNSLFKIREYGQVKENLRKVPFTTQLRVIINTGFSFSSLSIGCV